MEVQPIVPVLVRLSSARAPEAWAEFLEMYSPLILQVARLFEKDADHVADCFLFVCQQLCEKRFRRLRRFRPEGPASFSTWLRAVARNLCLDWRRQEFGRHRVFESVARLSALDREVFRCVYEQGMPLDEAFLWLRARFPNFQREQLVQASDRVRESLTPRQLWLLSARSPKMEPLEAAAEGMGEAPSPELPHPGPNPETLASLNEQRAALDRALSRLAKPEALLIRLRFEEGLTLEQVARVTGFRSAQEADRRIREVLARLRKEMSG